MRLRAQFFISALAGWLFLVLGAHTQDSNKGSSDPESIPFFHWLDTAAQCGKPRFAGKDWTGRTAFGWIAMPSRAL